MTLGRQITTCVSAVAAMLLLLMGLPAGHAAASGSNPMPRKLGKAFHPPGHAVESRRLAQFAAGQDPVKRALIRATAVAAAVGRQATAGSMTTSTTTVTASPRGLFTERSYVLPVRVRRGRGWVPVSTRLHLVAGRLSPAAVPGDSVSFSAGGAGAMATIAVGAARLSLWWPGHLPVPVISGPSATYRNVRPGVDLVLTATSESTGGFKEILVVKSAKAAAALGSVNLRVTTAGTHLAGTPTPGLCSPTTPHQRCQAARR
jgi:hypothetical protein